MFRGLMFVECGPGGVQILYASVLPWSSRRRSARYESAPTCTCLSVYTQKYCVCFAQDQNYIMNVIEISHQKQLRCRSFMRTLRPIPTNLVT